MNKNGIGIVGLGLIVLGVLGILTNLDIIKIEFWEFWPFILLVIGLMFEGGYFFGEHKDPGLLIPGGIITTISAIFIICIFLGWGTMATIWPMFILAPGIGLIQFYFFGGKETGVLIPASILLTIGGYFLVVNLFNISSFALTMSIALILVGLVLIFNIDTKRSKQNQ